MCHEGNAQIHYCISEFFPNDQAVDTEQFS